MKSLIDAGANVNISDRYGRTALLEATKLWDVTSLQVLIEAGADINITAHGKTALLLAATSSLLRRLHPNNELNKINRFQCLKALLNAGVNVNERDMNGETALMIVANSGDAQSIEALTETGADVNTVSLQGTTALLSAASSCDYRCIVALLKAGVHLKELTARVYHLTILITFWMEIKFH